MEELGDERRKDAEDGGPLERLDKLKITTTINLLPGAGCFYES